MADDQRDDTIDDEVRKHYEIINAPNYYSHGKALAAARAHRAAVVKSSPEVAALRARVAELEAGAYALGRIETLRRCGSEITVDADVPLSDLEVNHALDVQLARQWLAEADRLEAEHGYAPDEARIRADERAKCEAEIASLRAVLSTLVDAVYRVCDWSEGSRVGDALAEAEALLEAEAAAALEATDG